MKVPSIYDFDFAMEVMILKNFAYLRHKEKYGLLTPEENNMLHETIHSNGLDIFYREALCLKPLFTTYAPGFSLIFQEFTENAIKNKYSLSSEQLESAVNTLLDETFQTLYQPINQIFPYRVQSIFGDVIMCVDLSAKVTLPFLDRMYRGFTSVHVQLIQLGTDKNIVLEGLKKLIYEYYTGGYGSYPKIQTADISQFISQKAEEIYAQLLISANHGNAMFDIR